MKKPKVKIKSNREEIVAINEKAKEQRLSYKPSEEYAALTGRR